MVAPGAKKPSSSRLDAAGQEALRARYEALELVEERFRDFDVVWAKVHGFPWWPGVLFHSWDVVRRAGIHTDPKIVASLEVPQPNKVPVLDAASGLETGAFRLQRHCLVMFLDKFNFSLVEIDPSNVASFTAHYQVYEHAVMGAKGSKKKTEFRRALVKAAQLLHMGKEYTEDDLVLLEEPSQAEKKQRVDEMMEFEMGEGSLDDAWDDRESAEGDAAFCIEEKEAAEKKPPRKSQKKTASRKDKVAAEVKDREEVDDEVVVLTPAKPRRKAPAKDVKSQVRKLSRKEVHSDSHVAVVSRSPSPIDLTGTPENEKKKVLKASRKGSGNPRRSKKKRANGDATGSKHLKEKENGRAIVLVLKDDNDDVVEELAKLNGEQVSDEVAVITQEQGEEPSKLILTPLSSIWTTGVSGDRNTESGIHTQLAYKQDFVWDDNVFTDELSIAEKDAIERKQAEEAAAHAGPGRERSLGKRQPRSVQQSHIRQNLMEGNLDPHTMVQCAAYRPKDYVEDPNSRSRGGPTLDPPFQIVVHPDAVFVADLHAHLATCEIIGFLGGKWDEASKTLYIQAAFPCRSLVIDGDDGSTDVEMDPGSEIELRGIIENAQLEVVGWYHSHPAFAPDPSVRDIENQTSYQQLFQRPSVNKKVDGENKPSEPFVGLIVGTYDTRRSTPVSLFRYFHTRGEKVSGGARRKIYMPYEFIPGRRQFRSVLQEEERERTRLFPMYHSVLECFKLELTCIKPQLPTDIKAPPNQRVMSKSSPSRPKVQGFERKRKQSSDGSCDKAVKARKAKRRRSMRSSSPTGSYIDLTGDDSQHLPTSENGSSTLKGTHETMQKGDSNAVKEETSVSNGVAINDEKVVQIVEFSNSSGHNASSSGTSSEQVELERRDVELQVAEVLADVVETTETVNSNENRHKRSRKIQTPKRINDNLKSSGGDEGNQLPTDRVKPGHEQEGATSSPKVEQHAGSNTDGAAEGLAIKVDVHANGASAHTTTPRILSSFAVKYGPSPSTTNGASGRKRNRKPQKTTKNSNWSASPLGDGPSSRRSPSPTNPPAQTFYEAFQAKGPCFPNGGTHEEVAPPSTCSSGSKPDNILVDDMQYIEVNENMGMSATSHDDNAAEDKGNKTTSSAKTLKHDDLVNHEVRHFVASLVEQVVAKLASDISASVAASTVPNGSFGSSNKMLTESAVKVETKSESLTSESAVGDIDRKRDVTVRTGSQLFGSNQECEDIQTSLQKMASYLEILKPSQAFKPSESGTKPQTNATLETESKLPLMQPESKQHNFHVGQDNLTALRTKYGPGVSGCTEQVITLVDYYRDFERRTDLSEIWKSRITKLEKIERSLSEYVQYLNIRATDRHDFIKDLISYLRKTWTPRDRRR